jgi:hypothetical protein
MSDQPIEEVEVPVDDAEDWEPEDQDEPDDEEGA